MLAARDDRRGGERPAGQRVLDRWRDLQAHPARQGAYHHHHYYHHHHHHHHQVSGLLGSEYSTDGETFKPTQLGKVRATPSSSSSSSPSTSSLSRRRALMLDSRNAIGFRSAQLYAMPPAFHHWIHLRDRGRLVSCQTGSVYHKWVFRRVPLLWHLSDLVLYTFFCRDKASQQLGVGSREHPGCGGDELRHDRRGASSSPSSSSSSSFISTVRALGWQGAVSTQDVEATSFGMIGVVGTFKDGEALATTFDNGS
jgi:hypothetical protein